MTTKETEPKTGLSDWIKSNLFGCINLILILVTFSYNYGIMTSKITATEAQAQSAITQIQAINLNGTSARPAYEARLIALEKKTDDLSVLKNIVQTQSDNIKQLTDTVRSDHDILIQLIAQLKKP